MRKENLWLLINTMILLLVGIIFVVVVQLRVPKNPEDKIFNQTAVIRNETKVEGVPSGNSYSVIDYKAELQTKNGKFLATVYNVKIKNSYNFSSEYEFGTIELLVAVDENDKAHVEVVYLNQSDWTVKGIQKYIYEYYNGKTLAEIERIPEYDAADLNAGATAVDSTGTIKDLVLKVMKLHLNIEEEVADPYVEIFGEGYTFENDANFAATEHVLSRELAKDANGDVVGSLYKLNGENENYKPGELNEITIYVALDTNNVVLGVVSPEDEYHHTGGGFRNQTLAFMETFVGISLTSIDTNYDLIGASTNSQQLVLDLLLELKEVLLP